MAAAIQFILNGRSVRIENCSPNTTLLEFLRGAGLTGAKEGCAEGDCGACSVVMIDRDAQGRPCYRAINSCLVPLCLMAGREIVSVEGVASGQGLHPVQRKMVECHGSQCGYCTPGFIMSLFEGYYRDDIHQHGELDDQLSGNLCRCTGYRPIRDAAIEAFSFRSSRRESAQNKTQNQSEQTDVCCYEDTFAERLKQAGARLDEVEYEFGNEKFFRPTSLARLLNLLQQFPDGRLVAGATELGLDITKRYQKFPTLISVEAVPELGEIKSTETEWHIGAAVTLTQIEEKMAEEFPALGDMLRVFGSRLIRNRATMGGNLVTASPIGDSAPVLLALDAKVVIASLQSSAGVPPAFNKSKTAAGGTPALLRERTLPISEFFVAYRQTALQTGEILKTIIVPRGISKPGLTRKGSWFKVSKRREMDISTVAACFTVDLDRQSVVRHACLAYGGVAAMPSRAKKTESALLGKVWNEETIENVLPILRTEFTPISDVRGSADYRSGLVTSLLEKFFHNSEGRVTRVPDPDENNLGLAKLVPPKHANRPPPHESGHKHVTGEAIYTDDPPAGKNFLEVWPVCAPHARARILKRDATAARQVPGIRAVLLAEDIPGLNDVGTKRDEILLADKEVLFHGHMVALVVGETQEACRAAAEKVVVEYEPLPHILTLRQALAEKNFHNEPNFIRRGNCDDALANAPSTLEGEFELGGQEHFYLETQAAWAERGEDGSMFVVSSTQHPSEVQAVVAHMLHLPANKVVVQVPRMGGGFGGKETQAATPAALAALAAHHTGQPVRVRFNRDQDMALTGHRHPFLAKFKVGFDENGLLRAARVHLWSNGGWAQDLSQAVTDRALFHLDNAYFIPAVEFRGQVAKTNLSSNTAFRGFGGPQGMLVMEEILDRVARRLGLPPEMIRERNLYRGKGETNTTPYGQEIGDNRLQTIWHELKKSAQLEQRRREIAKWNAAHSHSRRGIAMTPVKFGISFTVTHLNQAGALVLIYQDGTVQVNHGGTEMGQGIHTNIAAIAAKELGVKPEQIRVMPTSTDKVPNTSATAASAGTDLNGAAVKNACDILKARLLPVAQELLRKKSGREVAVDNLVFAEGIVFEGGAYAPSRVLADASSNSVPRNVRREARRTAPEAGALPISVSFAEVVRKAYLERISLSATGYYATPGIHYDRAAGRGRPFHYFANGAAVTEVEVDGFTGMHRVLRVDILHDVGDSVNEGVNRGQIEGGFVQGMGWLTTEELQWDDQGRLLTHSSDTYKIPSVGDTPQIFNVTLLKNATQKEVIYGSKAVGEPPLMLAISAREAIRDAVAAFGPAGREVPLAVPATCEAIWFAIQKVKAPNSKLQHPEKLQTSSSQKKRVSV
jgi:xanthine dehydrogenase small subunit